MVHLFNIDFYKTSLSYVKKNRPLNRVYIICPKQLPPKKLKKIAEVNENLKTLVMKVKSIKGPLVFAFFDYLPTCSCQHNL